MSANPYGSCADCTDGICSMNCSSAVLVTTAAHIAHDMKMGRFPERSSPALFLAEQTTTERTSALGGYEGEAEVNKNPVPQPNREG